MSEHTPADDAGEVDRLKASLLVPANRRADRLKAQRDEARTEADNLRVTLAAVAEVVESLADGSEYGSHDLAAFIDDLRTVLAAAPVSLADVRKGDDVATRIVKAIEAAREQYTVLGDNPVGTTVRGAFNIAIQAALEAIRSEAVTSHD